MDKTQAAGIKKHMLDAAAAIERARDIIVSVSAEDRATLTIPLKKIVSALHFDLLEAVYVRYPDLQPPPEPPVIISTLRWEDVVLPASVSEADLDSIIFSALTVRSQKTAMVIGKSLERCKKLALPVSDQVLAARILALAAADRIEGAGDLRKWRHSEVRLKHGGSSS